MNLISSASFLIATGMYTRKITYTHNPFVGSTMGGWVFRARSNYLRCVYIHCASSFWPSLRGAHKETVIKMIMKNHLLTMCDYNGSATEELAWFISPSAELHCFADVFYLYSSSKPRLSGLSFFFSVAKWFSSFIKQSNWFIGTHGAAPTTLNQYQLWIVNSHDSEFGW